MTPMTRIENPEPGRNDVRVYGWSWGGTFAAQAVIATGTAAAMRSARWWLPIHLVFLPLAVTLRGLGLPPGLYLGAFVILLLIYWTTFRTQVPLYLSNAETAAAVAQLLQASGGDAGRRSRTSSPHAMTGP